MAAETRRVIWRHPKGIYETVEVSGTGVFGVPYCYRETVYTQERDARGVARKEVQLAPPNGRRRALGCCVICAAVPAGMASISTRVASGISRIWTMRSAKQISSSARGRRCSRNNG